MSIVSTDVGTNRTGIESVLKRANEMLRASEEFSNGDEPDSALIADVRGSYAVEVDPMGTMPPPPTISGAVKAVVGLLAGTQPIQLLDKLGERLVFERTGVRLYEAILGKVQAHGSFSDGPTEEDIKRILLQEHAHFRLIEEIIRDLGADPTVLTPSANVHATMTAGILAVVVDPRTDLPACLEAALLAELSDNEGWETLLRLLTEAGHEAAEKHVRKALKDEAEHLGSVRMWIAAAQGRK